MQYGLDKEMADRDNKTSQINLFLNQYKPSDFSYSVDRDKCIFFYCKEDNEHSADLFKLFSVDSDDLDPDKCFVFNSDTIILIQEHIDKIKILSEAQLMEVCHKCWNLCRLIGQYEKTAISENIEILYEGVVKSDLINEEEIKGKHKKVTGIIKRLG